MEPQMEQQRPDRPFFPAGRQEWIFVGLSLLLGWLLCNSILYGGFQLGFALFAGAEILCAAGYLLLRGHKLTLYSGSLFVLSLIVTASFARSDDGFVKFVMFCFLLLSVNLGLCLLSGQNRRAPKGITSLLDAPRLAFMLGIGKLSEAFRGLYLSVRNGSSASKKGSAVLVGLVIALPLLLVLISLLVSADMAFEGLLSLLPEWDPAELISSLIFGTILAAFFYTRGAAAHHAPKSQPASKQPKSINALTVNTVLIAVSLVYAVYLLSQLAYFSGGFSGILPENYTLSQYARRGFFEMTWLCGINLAVVALAIGLVSKKETAPLLTRLLCLFIGIVTLFLVVAASAKMLLYIDSFGLTRLRVLTEVIMLFLGLATVFVSIWIFIPKLPYMKAILLTALVMGATVAWVDVDTQVAKYNVTAYQCGHLESVDVNYLSSLGYGAVPYIAALQSDPDPAVAQAARDTISYSGFYLPNFRSWNYVAHQAKPYLTE